jgi:hypothetical protein
VAERSGDTAFARTGVNHYPQTPRPLASGVAAAAFPPQSMMRFDPRE